MDKKLVINSLLASGRYGEIFLASNSFDDQFVVKKIDLISLTKEDKLLIQKEVDINKQISSPYIVKYYDSYNDCGYLHILLEYCNLSDLSMHISRCRKNKSYFLQESGYYLLDVSNTTGVIDVKPENILLNRNSNNTITTKLTDFGLSWKLKNESDSCNTFTGSPIYMAPEIIKNERYNSKVDIWSLGCVVVEMCNLFQPFIHSNIDRVAYHIVNDDIPIINSRYSDKLSGFIKLIFNKNAILRPSAKKLLNSLIFENCKEEKFFTPIVASRRSKNFLPDTPVLKPIITKFPDFNYSSSPRDGESTEDSGNNEINKNLFLTSEKVNDNPTNKGTIGRIKGFSPSISSPLSAARRTKPSTATIKNDNYITSSPKLHLKNLRTNIESLQSPIHAKETSISRTPYEMKEPDDSETN